MKQDVKLISMERREIYKQTDTDADADADADAGHPGSFPTTP